MKIFKKFLILSLFSLLFIVNVNAVTYKNIFYSNDTIDVINNYSSLFDNIADYITNNAQSLSTNVNIDFVNDKNILVYDTEQNFSNGNINVYVVSKNHNVQFGNNRTYYLEFAYSACQVSFDTTNFSINNISCSSGIASQSKNLYGYFDTGITYFFDWRLGANNEKYFANNSPYYLNINNETLIVDANSQVSLNQFTFSLNKDLIPEPENPNKCISYDVGGQIGTVRNVKSISFRVHDTSNALDYPIEGYFHLVSPQFNDVMIPITDYLDITVDPGPTNEGDYNFNYNIYWVNESGDTINDLLSPRFAIYFDYELLAQDDIDTNLDVIITLSIKNTVPAGNITFFNDTVDIYANIYNCNFNLISYGYVDNNNNYTSSDSNLLNYIQDNNLGDISPLLNTDLLGPGPVDSILLLPLNIMQSLLSVVNSNTCQPLVLPLPHLNSNLILPCINTIYSQIDGLSTFINWLSAIISAFILYEYFIGLYKWVDNLLTFRENNHFGGF